MKYEYKTVTGKHEIEVDEQFYDILFAMDTEEFNSNRKHSRRWPISLENADYDGDWFEDGTDILGDLIEAESRAVLHRALAELPPSQAELIRAIAAGISPAEYARKKGVSKAAVSQQLERARKNLEKTLR